MNADDEADGIDLIALCMVLWRHKVVIILSSICATAIAAALAFTAPHVFRAEVTVVPVRESGMSGGALAGQLGALSSLVGLNLGQSGGSGQDFLSVLESRSLVEEFIKRNNLLPALAGKSGVPPSIWRAVKLFQGGVLSVVRNERKGLIVVAVEWSDPVTAAKWANGFVALANEIIRARAIDHASKDIEFLNKQIAKTDAIELRQVFFDIIKNETKTLMLANGRADYAFEVVDPAVAPEVRISPRRALMLVVGFAAGAFLGILLALLLDRIRSRRPASRVA